MIAEKPITIFQDWINDALNGFLAENVLCKSARTCIAYEQDLKAFFIYLQSQNVKRITYIKTKHVIGYLGYCKIRGYKDKSLNRYFSSISKFSKWLLMSKIIKEDFTLNVPAPKCKQKKLQIPTHEQIRHLLEQPNIATESGIRDKAMLELLYSSGLRASELCDLEINDLGGNQVRVMCGKGEKTRTLPITKEAQNWIFRYVNEYRGHEEGYLFITLQGKRIRSSMLYKIVKDYARKADIPHFSTHTMRHACATHLLDQGADSRMIQELLGHSSLQSTQIYTQLSSESMQKMFQQFHPRVEYGRS